MRFPNTVNEAIVTEVYEFEPHVALALPLALGRISAGFPSPADDYIDKNLDLNEFLIEHPAATFFVRVEGESMVGAGIQSDDILIVDRAKEATDGSIVIAAVDGELTVKQIKRKESKVFLLPENPRYSPLEITPEMNFQVWGVVTYVIHKT